MPHPTTRVLALLELLQAHHRLRGRELAERLGVDERTVRRDATRLAELGIPMVAERGRYGGYRLRPGYRLPPLMLRDEEAVAVVLGLVAGQRLGLSATSPAVETALAKIHRVLPETVRDRTAAVRESLDFTLAPREAHAPATEVLLTLAEAASRRRRVRLRYRSLRSEVTQRDLDPYGLVFHSGRWYVTGHDHRHDEVRTFRLDRVLDVGAVAGTFSVPESFDAVAHLSRSFADGPYRWEVEVFIDATPDQLRRRLPPTMGNLTETAGGVLLRSREESLDGTARVLASLEWPFVIHRPDELRDALRRLAGELATIADRVPPPRGVRVK